MTMNNIRQVSLWPEILLYLLKVPSSAFTIHLLRPFDKEKAFTGRCETQRKFVESSNSDDDLGLGEEPDLPGVSRPAGGVEAGAGVHLQYSTV